MAALMSMFSSGGGGGGGGGYNFTVSPSATATSSATSLGGNITSGDYNIAGINSGAGGMMLLAIVALVGVALLLFRRA